MNKILIAAVSFMLKERKSGVRIVAVEPGASRALCVSLVCTALLAGCKSEADLEQDRNGSVEPPAEVGDYYARIERPGGNGYRQGNNIKIEYHIQKAFISIVADPVQRFAWDGGPREIAARTKPPEEPPLVVSYTAADDPAGIPLAGPPSRRGRYRVGVVFPGNDRYMGASTEVEMRIE